MQLAGGGGGTAVSDTVDHHATHAADALPAVVVEGDGFLVLCGELLVEHVEHLQEGHVLGDVVEVVVDHLTGRVGTGLAPDAQLELHL